MDTNLEELAAREFLADELEGLILQWRKEKWWWNRAAIGHIILVKVWYRLELITDCLRGRL